MDYLSDIKRCFAQMAVSSNKALTSRNWILRIFCTRFWLGYGPRCSLLLCAFDCHCRQFLVRSSILTGWFWHSSVLDHAQWMEMQWQSRRLWLLPWIVQCPVWRKTNSPRLVPAPSCRPPRCWFFGSTRWALSPYPSRLSLPRLHGKRPNLSDNSSDVQRTIDALKRQFILKDEGKVKDCLNGYFRFHHTALSITMAQDGLVDSVITDLELENNLQPEWSN